MRFALLVLLVACHAASPPPAGPAPAPPPIAVDAAMPAAPPMTSTKSECMSDERQWGTTCCRTEGTGHYHWMSCHGPQLGKVCHRQGDCDIACECARSLVHHDGKTGVTGYCGANTTAGVWLCRLDESGKVSSLIID